MSYLEEAKTRTLERLQVASSQVITPHLVMDSAAWEVVADQMSNALRVTLRSYIMADKVADDYFEATEWVPASWWQHAKEAFSRGHPKLGRMLRPVRHRALTVRVKVERYLTYPEATIQFPGMGPARIFEQVHRAKTGIEDL